MSPWSIVVETFRVTFKPLGRAALVMAVIMLMPDGGNAMTPLPADGIARPAAAVRAPATTSGGGVRRSQPRDVATITREIDLGSLPPSAFGDEDAAR